MGNLNQMDYLFCCFGINKERQKDELKTEKKHKICVTNWYATVADAISLLT